MTIPGWLEDVDGIFVCVPDHVGRLSGKRIAAGRFPEVLVAGLPVPDFHLVTDLDLNPVSGLAASGSGSGYRNGLLMPLPHTLRRVPWDSSSGIVLADACRGAEDDRTLVSEAPRTVLLRQVERLRELGISVVASTELEFYVFRTSYGDACQRDYRGLPPYYHRRGDNDALVTGFFEPFAGQVRAAARDLGFPAETTQGEGGPGQLEINFPPSDLLTVADSHVLYKHAVKAIAQASDVAVTFMAKPLGHEAGSGCHLNLSLTDLEARSLMGAGGTAGESFQEERTRFFLAGLVGYSAELMLMHAPFGNSYRRFSTAGMAPRYVSWGNDNRTVMVRIAGSGGSRRLELRVPGADCNPYLSLAAAIAAGIAGIQNRLALPGPVIGDAFGQPGLPVVPLDLTEAVAAFRQSGVAGVSFGAAVCAHILGHAEHELATVRSEVTDRELIRGFESA